METHTQKLNDKVTSVFQRVREGLDGMTNYLKAERTGMFQQFMHTNNNNNVAVSSTGLIGTSGISLGT
jgi:hypothetical protein